MLQLPSFTTFRCLNHVRSIDDLESWQLVLLHSSQPQACPRLYFARILWKHAHDCWWATIGNRQSNTPTIVVSGRQLYSHQELCWHVTSWTLYDASCRKYFTLYLTIVVLEHGYQHLSHSSELSIAWVVFQVWWVIRVFCFHYHRNDATHIFGNCRWISNQPSLSGPIPPNYWQLPNLQGVWVPHTHNHNLLFPTKNLLANVSYNLQSCFVFWKSTNQMKVNPTGLNIICWMR